MTKFQVIDKNLQRMAILAKKTLFLTTGGSKRGENDFLGKSENVTPLHFLILSYMQKIYRVDFREKRGRETDRQTRI